MKYNRLIRENAVKLLEKSGLSLECEKLKGDEFKHKLCSLFLAEYKQTLTSDKPENLQVHYAEMLEVIRTLMVKTKTNIKEINFNQNQPLDWYSNHSPNKDKLNLARKSLLENFYELLSIKTEAVKDQLGDMIKSFKQLIEAHNISFVQVEQIRRTILEKLGGFKGDYLVSVTRKRLKTNAYQA